MLAWPVGPGPAAHIAARVEAAQSAAWEPDPAALAQSELEPAGVARGRRPAVQLDLEAAVSSVS